MRPPLVLDPRRMHSLPETCRLLQAGGLVVHPSVVAVAVGGSRGPRYNFRPDSDIDLSLIVDPHGLAVGPELGALLQEVLQTTLSGWHGAVEVDLAAVFDVRACGLLCFGQSHFDLAICGSDGLDCFGIYKIQRGFTGFVPPVGVSVEKLNPTLMIWRRDNAATGPSGKRSGRTFAGHA